MTTTGSTLRKPRPGPRGSLTYENGKYSVTMSPAGEIAVKAGDWLSKYSAAMYDDFFHIREFHRVRPDGRIVEIENPNLIRAGETLVHLPTFLGSAGTPRPGPGPRPAPARKPTPSDEEKVRITAEAVLEDLDLPGNHLPIAKWVIRAVGPTAGAANILALVAEAALGTVAAPAVTVLIGVAGPIGIVLSAVVTIANNMEAGMKVFGLKAAVYATVAWSFEEKVPGPPAAALENVRRAHANNPEWYLEKYRQAWAKASTQTISGMEARLAEKAIQPRHWKKLLREAGGNDRKKLALMLWDAGESEVSRWGNDLAVYRGMRSSVDYPN